MSAGNTGLVRSRVRSIILAAGIAAAIVPMLGAPVPALAQPAKPPSAAGATAPQPLPIKKITLYRSGVGGFERSGTVPAGQDVQLRFNTEQVNDILKSMIVLVDPAAGRLDAVSYGSKEPLAKRLASFGVNIADNPSLPELLNRLRGAPIRVTRTGETVEGTILGVEKRKIGAGRDQPPVDVDFLNLVTGSGMRSVAVPDISSFDILDKTLAEELTKALAALAEYRADRSKTVDLRFSGGTGGAVPVTVAYIHEMPVWKTSYRLVLPESPGAGATGGGGDAAAGKDKPKGQVTMQGWAIVENTTDEDWNDVRLSLVSGRPVSFQMDLYEPLYTYRPFVAVPTIPGVAPRAYEGGSTEGARLRALDDAGKSVEAERRMARNAPGSPPAPMSAAPAMKSMGRFDPAGSAGEEKDKFYGLNDQTISDYAAQAQGRATEVGEVFQYELASPVTIERQRSAMIPLLTGTLTGRRVSIFNLADGSSYPMRGVDMTNDSNLQLLPGPISVYDGSAYAGDAQIGHVGAGDKRLLAYAVDLDVAVLVKPESISTVQKLRIADGVFEQTVKTRSTTGYSFENKDAARPRTMIVEHAKIPGWDLVEPTKPAEETQALYRFELELAPGKAGAVKVVQDRTDLQRYGISDIDMPTVLAFHKDGKLSDAVLAAARDVAGRISQINEAERDLASLNTEVQEITADQSRIRENMKVADRTTQQYSRWMTKLNDQETKLEDLAQKRQAGQAKLDGLRASLNEFLRTLNVE